MQYRDETQRVLPSDQDIPRIGALTEYIMRRDRASRWKNICRLNLNIEVTLQPGEAIAFRAAHGFGEQSFCCKNEKS